MIAAYLIFGQRVRVSTIDSFEGELLHQELSIYPRINDENISLELNYAANSAARAVTSRNPSINALHEDGFSFTIGVVTISYFFSDNNIYRIDFSIRDSSQLLSWINKLLNIQFTNHKEAIGQWFHEFVMVPIGFLKPDNSLLHASAVKSKNGAILFRGTGGVGKTSLEIELCKNYGCSFITDDIAFLTGDGKIHPNLAYPKIYGYNIKENPTVRKQILHHKGFINKLLFKLHSLRGNQFVRRRIRPDEFYGKVEKQPCRVNSYLILSKENIQNLCIDPLEPSRAITLSQQVIFNEYQSFINHIVWHEYNSLLLEKEPKITRHSIVNENLKVLEKSLSKVSVFIVSIPLELSPSQELFKKQMIDCLMTNEMI
ncbi:MAG: hypothetical protein GDA51_04815 [Ekhidna sp.]|nr:hypothetical protein [Ekhidna sp.]